jgi:hypothetical protein
MISCLRIDEMVQPWPKTDGKDSVQLIPKITHESRNAIESAGTRS